MGYEKNVLLLKQIEEGFSLNKNPVGGIIRVEIENGVTEIYLSLLNFIAIGSGDYVLFIQDRKGVLHPFTLSKKPSTFKKTTYNIDISLNNICVGICYESKGIPLLIAFSSNKNDHKVLCNFKKSIADYYLLNFKKEESFINYATDNIEADYNDEAVATDNYFDYSPDIDFKKEIFNENPNNENGVPFNSNEKEEAKRREQTEDISNETDSNHFKKIADEPYYKTIENELLSLFNKFPHEEELERLFIGSTWAKINYATNKYYVVGIIKEKDKNKYICYGIPSLFSEYAPKELDGYCSFLPTSIFDLKGKGYWVMFQDAITGACLKKEKEKQTI